MTIVRLQNKMQKLCERTVDIHIDLPKCVWFVCGVLEYAFSLLSFMDKKLCTKIVTTDLYVKPMSAMYWSDSIYKL